MLDIKTLADGRILLVSFDPQPILDKCIQLQVQLLEENKKIVVERSRMTPSPCCYAFIRIIDM